MNPVPENEIGREREKDVEMDDGGPRDDIMDEMSSESWRVGGGRDGRLAGTGVDDASDGDDDTGGSASLRKAALASKRDFAGDGIDADDDPDSESPAEEPMWLKMS